MELRQLDSILDFSIMEIVGIGFTITWTLLNKPAFTQLLTLDCFQMAWQQYNMWVLALRIINFT